MAKNNAIIVTSIIAGVILIVALLALNTFSSIVPSTKNSVTVQGTSTIKAMPDLVSVYITIQTNGSTSAEATSANTDIYDNLIEEMIIAGFEESDVKTESFSVYQNTYWDEKDGRSKTDGYIANHYLKVELPSEKMNKVSAVVNAAVNAEAGISYINFELSQESQNEYKAQALKQASEDAMIKADSIASGFDKEVGKLLSVQTSDFGYYPWNVYTASGGAYREDAAMAKETAMNIQPGEEEISASITATFQIK
jgi:uncharacterized protein YggE